MVLNSLKIPDNVALNTALRENVFMMAICIELRIPLFLVGKPGSSKSLAKTILSTSMQGQASSHPLLKTFKEVLTQKLYLTNDATCSIQLFHYTQYHCHIIHGVLPYRMFPGT